MLKKKKKNWIINGVELLMEMTLIKIFIRIYVSFIYEHFAINNFLIYAKVFDVEAYFSCRFMLISLF